MRIWTKKYIPRVAALELLTKVGNETSEGTENKICLSDIFELECRNAGTVSICLVTVR